MSKPAFFVTGTDTDVGKTFVCKAMLQKACQNGLSTAGYKPVSAGCQLSGGDLLNDDALALQSASSVELSYAQVNPIAYADPVAPHLAAKRLGEQIDYGIITQGLTTILAENADLTLVEGAGGWRLPLGDNRYLSDLAIDFNLPVILVVGMKLGCLNHSLLTAEAIQRDGLTIAGWVANQCTLSTMEYMQDNLHDLQVGLNCPLLGVMPHLASAASAAQHITLPPTVAI